MQQQAQRPTNEASAQSGTEGAETTHMNRIKQLLSLLIGSTLIVEGNGRTFVKAPMWLTVLAALSSLHLAVLTVVLAIAFGMRVRIIKG